MKKFSLNTSNNSKAIFAIFFTSFFTHGLLLISDGIFVDGWHVHQNLINGKSDVIRGFFYQQGLPLASYFHELLYKFPYPIFFYRLTSFLSLTFSTIFVYNICSSLPFVTKNESLFISLISLTFPAFQQTIEHTAQGYLACLCLWLAMAWGALRIELDNKIYSTRYLYVLCRIIVWIGFLVSFHTPSLLTIHIGFTGILVLFSYHRNNKQYDRKYCKIYNIMLLNIDYILLPILYWVSSKILFPSYGFYALYNQPKLINLLNLPFWNNFIVNAIFLQLDWGIRYVPGWLVLLTIIALPLIRIIYIHETEKLNIKSVYLFFVGVIFLFLGMLPYIAVNKIPQPHGESTRFSLLIGVPVGIIFGSLFSLLLKIKSTKKFSYHLLVVFLLCSVWGNISNYLSYQSHWAIIQSVRTHLLQNIEWKLFSNYKINNYFEPKINERHSFYLRGHMPWEWAGIFESVYGNDVSRVMIGKEYDPYLDYQNIIQNVDGIYVAQYFLIDKLSNSPCTVELTLSRTPFSANLSSETIAIRYWWYKFTSVKQFYDFLENLTQVQLSIPREICK